MSSSRRSLQDRGHQAGIDFLVMEYLEGRASLAARHGAPTNHERQFWLAYQCQSDQCSAPRAGSMGFGALVRRRHSQPQYRLINCDQRTCGPVALAGCVAMFFLATGHCRH